MADFLIKMKSKIHGDGIFTTKEIKENSVFYEVPLDSISDKPKKGCAFIGNNHWVSDKEGLNHVNHSCEPNAILDISITPKIIARRDIKVGEEITVDYNETEKDGKRVPCDCKSENCRNYFLRIG